MSRNVSIKGVTVSQPDKMMFPEAKITKGDLARYYATIADVMLPYLKDRPLTMERYPTGIAEKGFFQHDTTGYLPHYVHSVSLKNPGEPSQSRYLFCRNTRTLVYLSQLECVTPHGWLSKQDKPDAPDKMIFDLDPFSQEEFDIAAEAATLLRNLLAAAGFAPFVMTTGSRGLHVVVPLKRKQGFDAVHRAASHFAARAADLAPDKITTESSNDRRQGRLFLNVARNAYGQTAVMPYAVRARANAPVATPLDWTELDRFDLRSDSYTIRTIRRRLAQKRDPWRHMRRHAVAL